MTQKVLCYDLGGSKIAAGVVQDDGKILDSVRAPIVMGQGKDAVIRQIFDIGESLVSKYPDLKRIGIASAGPLNPVEGVLLNPTHFQNEAGEGWHVVNITQIIGEHFGRPAFLENDAASAAIAEKWVGAAQNWNNFMVLTLGTGLGTGIFCNGRLLRSGRHLHTEAGHIVIDASDRSEPCACGNWGCAETYLSGFYFRKRAALRFSPENLETIEVIARARARDAVALEIFEDYSKRMAVTIYNYSRMFSPEYIIFTGSFSEASDLFFDSTRKHLQERLRYQRDGLDLMPQLVRSTLNNQSSLLGGACVAFFPERRNI